jgi:hypothetical protein
VIQHFIGGYIPSYVLFQQYSQILQLISALIFICGLLIVILSVYRFPAFLEFKWKENLLSVFIINQRNLKVIYTFDFKEIKDKKKNQIKELPLLRENKLLFSSGIIGIDDIISIITNTNNENIERIREGEFLILLNHGDEPLSFITYCLLVNKDMNSFSYFLKIIKNEFQSIYNNLLINLNVLKGSKKLIFSSFDKILNKMIE